MLGCGLGLDLDCGLGVVMVLVWVSTSKSVIFINCLDLDSCSIVLVFFCLNMVDGLSFCRGLCFCLGRGLGLV